MFSICSKAAGNLQSMRHVLLALMSFLTLTPDFPVTSNPSSRYLRRTPYVEVQPLLQPDEKY